MSNHDQQLNPQVILEDKAIIERCKACHDYIMKLRDRRLLIAQPACLADANFRFQGLGERAGWPTFATVGGLGLDGCKGWEHRMGFLPCAPQMKHDMVGLS